MVGNLFSGIFFTLYCHFNFLTSLVVSSGYIPSSARNTVLLVVLEHPGNFLAAGVCTVSRCFTDLCSLVFREVGGGVEFSVGARP